jgi:pimeloyl-ACP methyl ester carboxylesterase
MPASPPLQFLDGPHGMRIAYAVHGSGPLLIAPAWWVSHLGEDWERPTLRRFFERLGSSHTVVRYDRPGSGSSRGGAEAEDLDTEVAVLDAVFRHLGRDEAAIFAVSCAGPPAIAYAATHPGRVSRLVLYGSYLVGSDIGPREVFEAFCSLVAAHWGIGSEVLANLLYPAAAGGDLRDLGRRQRAAADPVLACRLLRMTYELDASDVASAVTCPTLVIHRKGDRMIPFEAGRKLAASLRNGSLVPLDGHAHLPWEGADDIVPVLEAFLGGTPLPGVGEDGASPAAVSYDRDHRELVIDGERHPLTPLEHGLLCCLMDRAGAVVTRDDALREVWQQPFAGSNVVDAVVRTLRRKLGSHADWIETVTGHGYRLRSGAADSN